MERTLGLGGVQPEKKKKRTTEQKKVLGIGSHTDISFFVRTPPLFLPPKGKRPGGCQSLEGTPLHMAALHSICITQYTQLLPSALHRRN